ncbi:MAG TPA: hypothetical protein VLM91_23255, partial [Candidatus Methylomirabilis sp.]|nr:hypothetical protein [Candidatus Methylomirabilis sp.]
MSADLHARLTGPGVQEDWRLCYRDPRETATFWESTRRELNSFDIVEGLVIRGGPLVEVLNGVSLHGGLVASWPRGESITAKFVVECLV